MAKANQVEKWLQGLSQKGWTLSAPLEGMAEGWCLKRNEHQLYISLNPYWLCFTLPLTNQLKTDYKHYLELCHRYFMVKFSVVQSKQLLLQIELPWDGLDRRYCHKAVEALSVYVDREGHKQWETAGGDSRGTNKNNVRSLRKLEVFPKEPLVQYFKSIEHLGWGLTDDLKENRWKATYKGAERSFNVHLYFNSSWVYFRVPLLAENTQDSSLESSPNKEFLYAYLLQLNEQIYWVKVGLYEGGQILMMLDIPLEMFDLNQFRFAAKTLATYADRLAYDIQIMANLHLEPQLASLMLKPHQTESPLVLIHEGGE